MSELSKKTRDAAPELERRVLDLVRREGSITPEKVIERFPEFTHGQAADVLNVLASKGLLALGGKETRRDGRTERVYCLPEKRYRLPEDYEFIQVLAKGGSGIVILAHHLLRDAQGEVMSKQKRVVKVLKPGSDLLDQMRFKKEILLMHRGIHHVNVMELVDAGETPDGAWFFAMRYYEDAKSLADLIYSDGRLAPERAARIVLQMANGLEAAHAKNVIHRDIKPENVLIVGKEETVQILDFGIAKFLEDANQGATRTEELIGTPNYMAPERLAGEAKPETDVYALGATLFQMLTGAAPFDDLEHDANNSFMAILDRSRSSSVAFPEALKAKMSTRLSNLVLWCMRKDPKARPSLSEVRNQLSAFLGEAKQRPLVPGRLGVWAAVSVGLILIAGAGIAGYMYMHNGAEHRAEPAFSEAPVSKSPETLEARLGRAQSLFEKNDFHGALGILDPLIKEKPELAAARELRARILLGRDAVKALDDLDQAIRTAPSDSLWSLKGQCNYSLNQLNEAQAALTNIKRPTQADGLLAARVALRLVDPARALDVLHRAGVSEGLLYSIASGCQQLRTRLDAQSPSDLAKLAESILRVRELKAERFVGQDQNLLAGLLYYEALALQHLGQNDAAVSLLEQAQQADAAFNAKLTSESLDLGRVAESVWDLLKKDDLGPAQEFLRIGPVLPKNVNDELLAPISREVEFLKRVSAGDYAGVLKSHVRVPIADSKYIAVRKAAAHYYEKAAFEPVDLHDRKLWDPREFKPENNSKNVVRDLAAEGVCLDSHDEHDVSLLSKFDAAKGYEIRLAFVPGDEERAKCYVVMGTKPDNKGQDQTLFLRLSTKELQLVELCRSGDPQFLTKVPRPVSNRCTITVILAEDAALVFVNRELQFVLEQSAVQLPGKIDLGVIHGSLTVEDVKIIR